MESPYTKFGICEYQVSFHHKKMGKITPIDPQQLTLGKLTNLDGFEHERNQLIIDEESNADSQPPRPKADDQSFRSPDLKHATTERQ